MSHHPLALGQVVEEGDVEGRGGIEEDVVDEGFAAFTAEAVDAVVHVLAVGRGNVPGFGGDLCAGFQIDEPGFAAKIEVAFAGVEDVEDDDFVFAVAEVFEAGQEAVGIVEEVGEDDDETPALDAFGQVVEGGGQVGVGTCGFGVLKGV